jgi:molecular chaperone DnaK (HSP70)
MTRARFSIGIDLGTTNTALAFVSLERDEPAAMLPIPQVESPTAIVESPTLPSFLYLPDDTPPRSEEETDAEAGWVIGRFARRQAADTPGRVVHSAKSWLAHHSADRSAPFLPWGSDELGRAEKLSPVAASTLLLRYLRDAWNEHFSAAGDDCAFDAQALTITVPASFDAGAQRLTLDAAQAAGYPPTVRLLEEPQAAFYHWLETHDATRAPWVAGESADARAAHVLVVDVGGGTSDFSLFAVWANAAASAPRIERIAVSEHLLLGGDNMDLALAHRLEPHFSDAGEGLSSRQWEYLVARCRDLKEAALATGGAPDDTFTVAIPGRGSRLIREAQSAQLARAEIERLLLDGFFPACAADEYPIRAKAGLRELGLPYARDPAVTRHLADFLRDRPAVDAVLFNGGSLHPLRLRERILAAIGSWQSGRTPVALENADPSLAVARGAARFGKLVRARGARDLSASAARERRGPRWRWPHARVRAAERRADRAALRP